MAVGSFFILLCIEMKRFNYNISVEEMRMRILNLTSRYQNCSVLDSCAHHSFANTSIKHKLIAGLGVYRFISVERNALHTLNLFLKNEENQSFWKFGMLTYDLKNEIENLNSNHPDEINFPTLYFFIPEVVILLNDDTLDVECYLDARSEEKIFQQLLSLEEQEIETNNNENHIETKLASSSDYLKTIEKIQYHLHRGDIYEMNYCLQILQRFEINPLNVYKRLTHLSPSPFSCFARIDQHYLLCASPERFIAREGTRIFSQPMKGTSKRSPDKSVDEHLKFQLQQSEKERAENVMIVDLVRNDLSRIAKRGSVKVDELFGVYTFPRVHQMVSTISAELGVDISFAEIIKSLFPMGSMTGAPKVRAMQLIEELENFKRGIFSGSVGYINPDGDFDFNVVIRSIIYNCETLQISIPVGSAITAKSDAMQEYDECMLKVQSMLNALGLSVPSTYAKQ